VPESPTTGQWLDVSVDRGRCCGYAVCVGLCPEVFDLDDDGLASIVIDAIPVELETAVRHAAASCPEAAITVADGPSPPCNGERPS
jgi:ferredoxin